MTYVTLADIHRKLEGTNLTERSEDLLTSNIFGCLRYIPSDRALVPFLQTAESLAGNRLKIGLVQAVYCSFWPSLHCSGHSDCQPDIVLGLETEDNLLHLIMVEAKYHSGPSSQEDTGVLPHHQLARELDQLSILSTETLGWETKSEINSRDLIYLTMDFSMPDDDIEKACTEYSRKLGGNENIYWMTWRSLPAILELSLDKEPVREFRLVMEDMLHLLEKKWLTLFTGIDPIKQHIHLSDFYLVRSSPYEWPAMNKLSSPPYLYKINSNHYEWPRINQPPSFYYEPRASSYIWPIALRCPNYEYTED